MRRCNGRRRNCSIRLPRNRMAILSIPWAILRRPPPFRPVPNSTRSLRPLTIKGGVIGNLIVKGHGAEDGVYDDNDNDFLTVASDGTKRIEMKVNGVRVDQRARLQRITNAQTKILLRSCSSATAASRIAKLLANNATVSGNHSISFGIPFTTKNLGWWDDYRCPPSKDGVGIMTSGSSGGEPPSGAITAFLPVVAQRNC